MSHRSLLLAALGLAALLLVAPTAAFGQVDTCVYEGTELTCDQYCGMAHEYQTPPCPCWPSGLSGVPYLCFDAPRPPFLNHFAAVSFPFPPAFYQISHLGCRANFLFIPAFLMTPEEIGACDEDLYQFCGQESCRDCDCSAC